MAAKGFVVEVVCGVDVPRYASSLPISTMGKIILSPILSSAVYSIRHARWRFQRLEMPGADWTCALL